MHTLINLTPHVLNEVTTDLTIPPSGMIARLDSNSTLVNTVNDIPIYAKQFGEIQNLPDSVPKTCYIVSGIMLDVAKQQGRTDCLSPGELVRDSKGKPIGCKGFVS